MPSVRTIPAVAIVALAAWLPPAANAGPLVMNSPTTAWTAVLYPNSPPDFSNEQGTGQEESDIVGNLAHPAFYTAFDDAGTASLIDGMLGFRIRLGADKNPAGFGKGALVGIDANSDGALDLFALVDNTGANKIALYDPGSGTNTSPATTSITTTGISYSETSSNYNWSQVTISIDPTATIFDIDADGNTDYFLSFAVSFQDLVNRLALRGITGVDQNTSFRYVLGTSTNASTLNQDIAGPNGGTSSAVSWVGLDAISNPGAPGGSSPVPEPGTASLLGLGLLALARLRRPV